MPETQAAANPTQTENQPPSANSSSAAPDDIASKLADAQNKEREYHSRLEKIRKENEEKDQRLKQYDSIAQKLKENGHDLNLLIQNPNAYVGQAHPLVVELQSQVAALTNDLSAQKQAVADRDQLDEIKAFVANKADDFELIRATKLEAEVQSLIKTTYQKSQKILSYAEAAEMIEKHLEKHFEETVDAAKGSKKFKKIVEIKISDVKVPKSAGVSVPDPVVQSTSAPTSPQTADNKRKIMSHDDIIKDLVKKYPIK